MTHPLLAYLPENARCAEALAWVASLPETTAPLEAWRLCENPSWMFRYLGELGIAPGRNTPELLRFVEVVRLCVREAWPHVTEEGGDVAKAFTFTDHVLSEYIAGRADRAEYKAASWESAPMEAPWESSAKAEVIRRRCCAHIRAAYPKPPFRSGRLP